MKKWQNESRLDRILRLIVALTAALIALNSQGGVMVFSWAVCIIATVSGLTGFAMPYKLLGISTLKKKKQAFTVYVSVVAVIALVGVPYSLRGWIRQTVVPYFVTVLYLPSIDRDFTNVFSPVNTMLASSGVKFGAPYTDSCGGIATYFQYFSETVPCYKGNESDTWRVTSSLKSAWKNNSPVIQRYLLSSGWHKDSATYGSVQSMDKVFESGKYGSISYTRNIGKDSCTLDIEYEPQISDAAPFYINESCGRNIDILGGSYNP